jgi:hypothetical protein
MQHNAKRPGGRPPPKQRISKQRISKKLKRATDAFTGFVVEALREEFLLWDKTVNFGMAEMVWNAYSMGAVAELGWHCEPKIAEMHEVLTRLRATRWRKEKFLAFGLEARSENGEIHFRFDLTFDEGRTFQPCEIVWDPSGRDLIPLN